jgi:hypothetical protein
MMKQLLETSEARVAAFSGYGLAIQSPGVTELPADERRELRQLVLTRYRIEYEVPHFGQALTTLQVFVKR